MSLLSMGIETPLLDQEFILNDHLHKIFYTLALVGIPDGPTMRTMRLRSPFASSDALLPVNLLRCMCGAVL